MSKKDIANKDSDDRVTIRLGDLKQKIDGLFVDLPNRSEKTRYALKEYFRFVEKFPYLNVSQETLSPQDAGFPPCNFVTPLYDGDELIGFHCSLRTQPVDLPRIKVGRLTFKACTVDVCWTCVEVCKKSKVGLDLFSHITLQSISQHKDKYKPDSTRVVVKGRKGRPMVNREEAFKLFALDRPRKYMKKQLHIAEATWWRLKREYEALSSEERDKIVKSITNYS